MSKSSVKKNLQALDRDKLIELILGVYDFNKEAKTYIENIFEPQFEKQLQKNKEIIDYEFDPWETHRMNYERCRQCISEFQKLNPPVEMVADLMLYLAEAESHCTQYCGDYDLYDNTLEDYENALEFIASNELEEKFEEQIVTVYKEAQGGGDFPKDMENLADSICWKLFYDETEEGLIEKDPKNVIDDYDDSDMDFGESDAEVDAR